MSHTLLVSIIIPTYNRAHLIGETLDSILAQTHQNWECIVVDDGSTDGTEALMSEYVVKDSRFQYHHRLETYLPGGNGARNYGFALSKGDFVQWFDSDDLMMADKLHVKVRALIKTGADFVVCYGAELSGVNKNPIKKWNLQLSENMLFDHLIGKIIFGTNGPMFKRSYLSTSSLFNESLLIKQEWEFFNRLLIENPSITIIDKVLYIYRVYRESKRGTFNYAREQNKMRAHRLVFKMLNNKGYFSKEEDFLFRKYFQLLFLNHYKTSLRHKEYKDMWYVMGSVSRTFSLPYSYEVVRRILKKPKIFINLFNSFFNLK